jgi:hypothetical protein
MAARMSARRFAKMQASYAEFAARKVRKRIEQRQDEGAPEDELETLYDDEFFWLRMATYMHRQRAYLVAKEDV